MTLAQLRAKLRRRVNEEVGSASGGWTDAELNAEINQAYAWIQKEVLKVSPNAHLFWDTMDQTSGTAWYPLPDTFGIRQIGQKASASATTYTKLKHKVYEDIQDLSAGSTTAYYSLMGQWIGIFPTPSVSITNGIQIIHTPIMTVSADTDVPRVKTPLHEAIMLKAKDQVLGDLDMDSQKNRQDLADIINDIPLWYDIRTDSHESLQPDGVAYIPLGGGRLT